MGGGEGHLPFQLALDTYVRTHLPFFAIILIYKLKLNGFQIIIKKKRKVLKQSKQYWQKFSLVQNSVTNP